MFSIRSRLHEDFQPGLQGWDFSRAFWAVWATRAEKSHVIARKISARAEKMIDRHGKMQTAKTTKATDKFINKAGPA